MAQIAMVTILKVLEQNTSNNASVSVLLVECKVQISSKYISLEVHMLDLGCMIRTEEGYSSNSY